MLKKSLPIWSYLIGTILFLGILVLIVKDYIYPNILNSERKTDFGDLMNAPRMQILYNLDYIANFATNNGDFTIDLFEKNSPKNVNNFIFLSNKEYYNGTKVHRLVSGLLFQGGDRNTLNKDPLDDGFGRTGYFIVDEVNWDNLGLTDEEKKRLSDQGYSSNNKVLSVKIEKYSVVMANNGPNTNSTQFFIVTAENNDPRLEELQGKYTVIGKVIDGKEVIDAINLKATEDNKPLEEIVIKNIKISSKE